MLTLAAISDLLKKTTVAILPGVSGLILLVIIGVALRLFSKSETTLSDEALIAKTKELPEVQAFIAKYPTAYAYVDRGSDILVTHVISKSIRRPPH